MRDDVDVPSRPVPRASPRARSTPEVSFRSTASFVSFASAMFAGARAPGSAGGDVRRVATKVLDAAAGHSEAID